MPTQKGVWLNDMKRLFPELRKTGKKHEVQPFRISQLRPFKLSIENDQLLAQQGIF